MTYRNRILIGLVGGATLVIATAGMIVPTAKATVFNYPDGATDATPIIIVDDTTQFQVLTGTATQSGVISEAPGPARPLEKTGGGDLRLTADNTYTGKTTVSAGNLFLGSFTTTGSIAGNIELTSFLSSLIVLRTNDITIAGDISGNGAVAKSAGDGTVLTLAGNNSHALGTFANNGTIRAGSSTAFGTGSLFAASGATFDLNGFDISALNATGGGTFDLDGQTLTLNGGGTSNGTIFTAGNLTFAAGADQTFSGVNLSPIANLMLDGTLRLSGVSNVAPAALTLGASGLLDLTAMTQAEYVAGAFGGAGAINLDNSRLALGTGDIDVTLSSAISGVGGSLRKTGMGTLTLSGNNIFTGGIALEQGTLRLESSGAAGTGIGAITTTGSVISYASGVNSAAPIVINSGSTQLEVLSTHIATQSGVISESMGPRPLEKIGGGTLLLSAANTYTGLTTVSQGQLQLVGNGALAGNVALASGTFLVFDRVTDYTFGGNISGAGGIFQGQLGTITLTGTNTHALTQVGLGTLKVSGTGTLGASNVQVSVNGVGTTLDLEGTTQNIGTLTINQSATNSVIDGTLNVATSIFALDGTISANLTGTANLNKFSGATATLSGSNSFAGTTTVSAGTLILQGGAALADSNAVTVNAGGTLQLNTSETIGRLEGNGNVALAGSVLTVNTGFAHTFAGVMSGTGGFNKTGVGHLTLTGANTYTGQTNINAGKIILSGGGELAGNVFVSGTGPNEFLEFGKNVDYTYGGVISGGNASHSGTATTTWTGANTHSFTGITRGRLRVAGAGTFGATTSTVVMSGGILDLNGTTQNINTLSLLSGTPSVTGAGTLNVASVIFADAGTISANLGGTGTLVKNTGATTTLSGANTYSGPTTINGGTLILQGGNAIRNGGAVNGSGGVLQIDGGEQIFSLAGAFNTTLNANLIVDGTSVTTYSGVISGGGGLYHYGAGALTLTDASAFAGGTTIQAGTIILGGANGTIVGNVSVASLATLEFNRSNPLSFGGVISGAGTVRQNNPSGAIMLTGANTLQGTMLVTNGTLAVSGAGTFGDGVSVTLSANGPGVTVDLGGTSQSVFILNVDQGATVTGAAGSALTVSPVDDFGSINVGTGTITVDLGGQAGFNKIAGSGSNIATLSGDNTFAYNTQVMSGTLILQDGAALADTNRVIVHFGATLQLDADETIGELINNGNVALGANTLTLNYAVENTGTVSGTDSALVIVKGATNFFENSDLIESTGLGGIALHLSNPSGVGTFVGTFDNSGTIRAINGTALLAESNVSGGMVNSGTLEGINAVNLDGSAGFTFTNSGTLTGNFDAQNGGVDTLRFTGGSLSGSLLTDATDILSVEGGSWNFGTQTIGELRVLGGDLTGGAISAGAFNVEAGTIGANLSGAGGLTKTTVGTVILSGTNTYNGATAVDAGTLVLQGGFALADSNAVTVASGATLRITSEETIGSIAGAGTLDLTTKTLMVGNSANTSWTGTVTGDLSSGLHKVGTGTFSITGDILNEVTTVINGGEINFNGTAAGDVAINAGARLSGTHTIGGDLFNLGTLASGNSPGTTTVLGNYTGGGTLEVEVQFDNAATPNNGVTHDFLDIAGDVLGGPTTIDLFDISSGLPAATTGSGIEVVRIGGASTITDFTMSTYFAGAYQYELVYFSNYIGGVVDSFFLQSSLVAMGCAVDNNDNLCAIDDAANMLGAPVDAAGGLGDTLRVMGATDFTFDVSQIGTVYENFEVFQKGDANTVTLTGVMANANQGVQIQDGTLIAGAGTLGGLGAVNISAPGELQTTGTLTVGSIAGTGTIDIQGAALRTGFNDASTNFSGILAGTGDLEKYGTGTLTLAGANTNTGLTWVLDGTLQVSGGAAIDDLSRVIVDPMGTLRLLADEEIGSLEGTLISGGTVDLGNHTLTLGGNDYPTLYLGPIIGAGGLTKVGDADLTLGGTNGYTGATAANGGTLTVQGGFALSDSSAVSVGLNGTLVLLNSETVGSLTGSGIVALNANTLTAGGTDASTTFAGDFTGTGAFAKAGIGTLSLSGSTAAASVDMLVQGGRLIAGAGTLGTASANTVASGATFEITGNNTVTSITGPGAVEINGADLVANQVLVNEFTLNGGMVSGGVLAANTVDLLAGIVASQLLIGNANQVTITAAASVSRPTGAAVLWLQDATGVGIVFDNDGTVESFGGAHALTASAPRNGPLTLDNSGSFTANGGGNAIDLANASGPITITNSGTISGAAAILTGAGNDVLNLTTSSVIAGRINLGGGTNTLNLAGMGAGTIFGEDSSGAPSVTDWVGFDNLNVDSGTWTLLGGGYYDNVVIDAGATLIADDTGIGGATDGGLGAGASGSLQLTVNGTFRFVTNRPSYLYGGNPSSTLAGNGVVDLTAGGGLVLAGNNTFTGQFSIANGARVVVTGTMPGDFSVGANGQLIVGATFVPAGVDGGGNPVVDVGGAGATGDVSGNINVAATGLLKFNRSNNSTYAGQLSGAGKLIKDGAGVLTLSGDNSGLLGGIDILHGGIFLANDNAAGTGPITTFGSVISYANAVNIATPIVISSNTTQLEQIGGSATQSGPISEIGGTRPLEKIGNGNLTLSGTNTFTGPMTISDGTLTLQGGAALADGVAVNVAAPGTLALNTSETVGSLAGAGDLSMSGGTALTAGGNNTSTLFSGDMTGGGFTKTGSGNFTFTGVGTFGGPLNVNGGTFTKTGGGMSGASAFNVATGATAFLGATTAGVNGAGIAATGMGAISNNGTLYLDDNTTVSGSSLALGAASNLNLLLTTNTSVYPQISVSGAANVAGNLGVYLDPLSFSSTLATTFTYDNVILGGSRSGTFGTVNLLASPSGLFSIAAAYGANDVDLTVTRSSFVLLGGGVGNAPGVGGAVEDIFVIGTSDPDLLNLISTIGSSTPDAIAAIYYAISGSTSAETTGGGLRTDDPWKQTVAERINAARTPGCTVAGESWCLRRYAQAASPVVSDVQGNLNAFDWLDTGIRETGTDSAWVRAVGSWSKVDASDFATGSTQLTGGVIGGLDHVFDSLFLAGIAGQYLETSANFDESRNASHIRSAQLGAYMSYGGAEAYVNANASVIGTQSRSERFATVGLLNYEIDSFMRGLALTVSAEAGTIMEIDGYRFEPSVAMNYQYSKTDDYAERGGGGLGLIVRPDDSESLRSVLTARLSRVYDIGDRKIVPQVRIDWRHEYLDRGQSFTAAFAGAPNVLFDVEGTAYARDQLTVGAGLTLPLAGHVTGYVDALGTVSEDSISATALVGVRTTW